MKATGPYTAAFNPLRPFSKASFVFVSFVVIFVVNSACKPEVMSALGFAEAMGRRKPTAPWLAREQVRADRSVPEKRHGELSWGRI